MAIIIGKSWHRGHSVNRPLVYFTGPAVVSVCLFPCDLSTRNMQNPSQRETRILMATPPVSDCVEIEAVPPVSDCVEIEAAHQSPVYAEIEAAPPVSDCVEIEAAPPVSGLC